MIVCLGTTPAIQRVMIFDRLVLSGVNRARQVVEAPAGKAVNVARVLRILGGEVVATGFVGGDRGRLLCGELDRAGIRHDFITVEPQTRMCVTVVDRGGETHTELVEESRPVEGEAWPAMRSKLIALLRDASMLTLSGTLTPQAPSEFYHDCVRLAADAGVKVVLDATGIPLARALPARPDIVKPNRGELGATVQLPVDSEDAVCAAMRRLLEMGARSAVVTLGSEGAMATDGQRWWCIHAPSIRAVNSIGSGDAFTAGMAFALARGEDLAQAVRLGTACGAANALTLLAGEVHPGDVQRLLEQVQVEAIL